MIAALILIAPSPILLAIKAPVGAKFVTDLTFKMKGVGGGGWLEVHSTVSETLTKKEGKNDWWAMKFDVTKTLGEGELKAAGKSMEDLENYNMSFLRNPQNQIVKAKVDGIEVGGAALKGTSDVTFSSKPVDVGGTWPGTIDLGGRPVKATYRFEGPRVQNGKPSYLISATFSDSAIKMIRPYRFFVEKGSCKTLFAEGAASVTISGKTLDISFQMKRR